MESNQDQAYNKLLKEQLTANQMELITRYGNEAYVRGFIKAIDVLAITLKQDLFPSRTMSNAIGKLKKFGLP